MTLKKPHSATRPDARIAELMQTIHAAEAELQQLTGKQLDAVITPGPRPYPLQESQQNLRLETQRLHDLRASEERLRTIVENEPECVKVVSVDGRLLDMNPAGLRMIEADDARAVVGQAIVNLVHADDRATFTALHRRACRGETGQAQFRINGLKGTERWMESHATPLRAPNGTIESVLSVTRDISERRQADLALIASNRALQLLSRCNEVLIRSKSEADLLHDICRIAVDIGGFAMAWVGYAQDNPEKTIEPQASAGQESGDLAHVQLSWSEDHPNGQSPPGQVIRSGEPMVIRDVSEQSGVAPWLANVHPHASGVVILPLKNQTGTFGVLVLYADKVRTPLENELHLLRELADDLAFGIGNLRSQADRRRLEAAVVKVAASVSMNLGANFFNELAASAAEATDAVGAFVARLQPGEPPVVRTVAAVLDGRVVENFDYPMRGTPCELLMDSDECVVPTDATQHFPGSPKLAAAGAQAYVGRRLIGADGQTLGLMYVLFRKPLKDAGFVVSTLRIFAARAAGEFERLGADTRIREQAALLDKATDAIFVRDLEHRVLFWNRGAERVYGWTSTEAQGRITSEFLHPNAGHFDAAVAALLDRGEWRGELEKTTKAGTVIKVESRWTVVRDEQGAPTSVLCIETDITEKKKLEAQFLRAQRLESVGTLASGIAHDMNNILAPILMSVVLLKEDAQDEATRDVLKTLESCSQRGADLVQQLLSFARGVESQRVAVDLAHVIRDLQKIMTEVFPKNVEFDISADHDLWAIVGDPSQLHQVLLNLCVNARDAMPHGGKLTIAMENVVLDEIYSAMNQDGKNGPYVRISVTDTGTGIPPAVVDKIFEPFFTTKEQGKGTGLGLSTVMGILKNHDGFVNVYSEEGKGTQFKVYLPAQTSSTQGEDLEVAPAGIPMGHGELILLVDDENGIREIASKTLIRFGYRVMEAANGAEAVALYVQHRTDIALVLTDVSMPIMDGVALVTALRALNRDVRVLVSSGLPISSGVAKAMEHGVRQFIPKPYTADKMLGIIHQELHR